MRTAVYYPHTEISSESLIKSCLLLWDQVEYLVPWEGFQPSYVDKKSASAIEMIGKPHPPTKQEREEAHQLIEDLVTRPLPDSFLYQSDDASVVPYEVYTEKFMSETWQMLRDAQMAGAQLANADMPVSQCTGLSIMGILADCCAGETKRRITDRGDSYAKLTSLLTGPASDQRDPNGVYDRIVPITLHSLDLDHISLEKLIDFRNRERSQSGHTIRDLRHRYVDKLEAFVDELTTANQTDGDLEERERIFVDDMKDDLAELGDELRIEASQVLFSKEMIVAGIAAAGTVAATIGLGVPAVLAGVVTASGAPVSVGGLVAARNKYMAARRSVLKKHPMAYLYELKGGLRL